MAYFVPLTELCIYVLYSILTGHVALQFVSKENKPKTAIQKPVLLLSTLGIIIFSLTPLVQTISYFEGDVGLGQAIQSVVLDFQIGRAWIFSSFAATFLWISILVNGSRYSQAALLFTMILSVGYSGHVASLSFWTGLFSHSIHFLVVTLWIGILIHVTWFSKAPFQWIRFLSWFTPFAIFCVVVVILSGINLMLFVIEPTDYIKASVLPYGQMLLLKHISIIPVLVFAFINGVLARRSGNDASFNPLPWIRGETILLSIVFYFTAVLGTLSPPHEVDQTIETGGASKWVEWLVSKNISSGHIGIVPSLESVLLLVLSGLLLIMLIASFKKVRPAFGVVLGISFIATLYIGLMISLTIS